LSDHFFISSEKVGVSRDDFQLRTLNISNTKLLASTTNPSKVDTPSPVFVKDWLESVAPGGEISGGMDVE